MTVSLVTIRAVVAAELERCTADRRTGRVTRYSAALSSICRIRSALSPNRAPISASGLALIPHRADLGGAILPDCQRRINQVEPTTLL